MLLQQALEKSNNNMNEFNNRQLNIMLQKISSYEKNELSLGSLINDLEALLEILESPNSFWKDEFRGLWWDLEQVYAFSLSKNVQLNIEDNKIISDSLKQIKKLIKEKT